MRATWFVVGGLALRLFVEEHPGLERGWFRDSNRLVLLSVADELALQRLLDEAARRVRQIVVQAGEYCSRRRREPTLRG